MDKFVGGYSDVYLLVLKIIYLWCCWYFLWWDNDINVLIMCDDVDNFFYLLCLNCRYCSFFLVGGWKVRIVKYMNVWVLYLFYVC